MRIILYQYNDTCLNQCPTETVPENITNICYHKNIYNHDSNNDINIISNTNNDNEINDEYINEILSIYSPKNGESLTIKGDDNIIYQITTNQNDLDFLNNINSLNNYSLSIIDIGDCETVLRKEYNISKNDL